MFSLLVAIGAVTLFEIVNRQSSIVNRLLSITLLCALAFVFTLRSMETLVMPATRGFGAFGYLVREQRASFDTLRALTQDNAVIGCSLNSGAVDLHAGRQTFRPATWSPDELNKFVDVLMRSNIPIFILEDGEELRDSISTLKTNYTVREVGRVDVPFYNAVGGGSENRRVALFQVSRVQ